MGITINSEALNNAATSLNVIGNNIANVNTSGYKQASFSELLKKASGGSSEAAGVTQAFTQGNIISSTNPLDMAISGNSLFRLDGGNGISYTRNSQFSVDSNNYIVNSFGDKLTGYNVDDYGKLDTSKLTNLSINTGKSDPIATTEIKLQVSLSNLKLADRTTAATFKVDSPDTYDSTTTSTIYDASGSSKKVQCYFKQIADTEWRMYTYVDDVLSPPYPKVSPLVEYAKLTFQPNGKISIGASSYAVPIMTDVTMDLSNSTKMEGSFSVNSTSQDGRTAADMTSYKVNNDGTIEAIYADGTAEVMAQVVLAKFDNLQGLTASSNNQWVESSLSGKPHLGIAGSGGFGSIQGGSTEGSNVDLTTEMVRLIAAQRAFQSAAEVVKKQDETVQTINRIGG